MVKQSVAIFSFIAIAIAIVLICYVLSRHIPPTVVAKYNAVYANHVAAVGERFEDEVIDFHGIMITGVTTGQGVPTTKLQPIPSDYDGRLHVDGKTYIVPEISKKIAAQLGAIAESEGTSGVTIFRIDKGTDGKEINGAKGCLVEFVFVDDTLAVLFIENHFHDLKFPFHISLGSGERFQPPIRKEKLDGLLGPPVLVETYPVVP